MGRLRQYLQEKAAWVEAGLVQALGGEDPAILWEAMRYSSLGGGKRVRAALVAAGAEVAGGTLDLVLPAAVAVEMIHAYSLIHDDLPCMDDDDMRRGKPTNHKVFGEANALLAGDALLTHAFSVLSQSPAPPRRVLSVITEVAQAAGPYGMVGGQVADLEAEGEQVSARVMEGIHRRKTGALIRVSLRSGALLAGASEDVLQRLTVYAEGIGLAFQIVDDLLDLQGDQEVLGKAVGSDTRKEKSTYPSIYGLERSRQMAQDVVSQAIEVVNGLGEEAWVLQDLAKYILERDH